MRTPFKCEALKAPQLRLFTTITFFRIPLIIAIEIFLLTMLRGVSNIKIRLLS
jgi:hypothetical protein